MESLQFGAETLIFQNHFMNSLPSKFRPKFHFSIFSPNFFCTSSLASIQTQIRTPRKTVSRVRVLDSDAQLKENWLASLSSPIPLNSCPCCGGDSSLNRSNSGPSLVIGIDPDLSGAIAVLKSDESGCSAQVFDSPHLQVLVGKRVRRRLDVKSIVQLLRSFDVPVGTTAYLEQSIPFPQDGKQGWWSGGFGYGLWIGILVASGISVVPVPSMAWKNEFELARSGSTKDDSRSVASALFPSLSSLLKRKKDHGRAEALLIAAYGQGLKTKFGPPCILEELAA